MPSALLKSATLRDAYIAARTEGVRHILLAGPPGVGKTTFAFETAALLKRPAWKIQFHSESTPSEMYGMHVPADGSFKWESGPLDMAYSKGGILILDEIVEASGPCKTALYGPLDAGVGGTISYVGRTFTPHKHYMAIATMNGVPWEGGLPDALLDRFDATFLILKPGEKQLEALDPDLRELCIDAYTAAHDPILGPDVTFRMLASFQKLRRALPLDLAVLSACHGNDKLAATFLEALALLDPIPLTPPAPKRRGVAPITATTAKAFVTDPVASTETDDDEEEEEEEEEEEDDEDWDDEEEDEDDDA